MKTQPENAPKHRGPKVVIDKETGFPVIVGGHSASPDEEMTPDRVFEMMQAQELQWYQDALPSTSSTATDLQ